LGITRSTKMTEAKTYWSTTERGRKAEDKLIESPYDIESWGTLVREAQGHPINSASIMYEKIVKQFPMAGRYWKLYIEQEVYFIFLHSALLYLGTNIGHWLLYVKRIVFANFPYKIRICFGPLIILIFLHIFPKIH